MKITFDPAASADLDNIFEWISHDSERAAYATIARIEVRVGRLAAPELAYMGRPGRDKGTHELVEAPYIIVYEVHEQQDEIVVISIVHGARDREHGDDER
jgi:plasmid stabilization system protein ParE